MQDIVLSLRLPRLMIGILAGGALAVAGAVLQTLTNNPLASAGTLGINAGAYFFVVVSMIFFPSLLGNFPFIVALVGAVLSSVLVVMLAGKQMEPVRVALTGMIISLLFASMTGSLQLLFENQTNGLFLWGSGTLVQLNWDGVSFAGPVIIVFFVLALVLAKPMDTLSLGEDIASSLGQNVRFVKLLAWAVAIVLAAATVSVVGPIGFIGLMAPHIVRMLGVRGHLHIFLQSFLWGSVMLIGADVLGRLIQPGQEVPVGAMTALIGGPWLLYLAWKTAKTHSRGDRQMGGTLKPVKLPVVITIVVALIIVIISLALSFNGTAWTTEWLKPVVWNFRVPRVLTAFIVGMMLAVAGVLLQGVLRNPLADASILGVTSMGGAGAMMLLVLFPAIPVNYMPLGAVVGAAIALGIILGTSWKNNFQPMLVALMGIAISAFGSAATQVFVVKAKLAVAAALVWLSGSTYAKGWDDVQLAVVVICIVHRTGHLFDAQFGYVDIRGRCGGRSWTFCEVDPCLGIDCRCRDKYGSRFDCRDGWFRRARCTSYRTQISRFPSFAFACRIWIIRRTASCHRGLCRKNFNRAERHSEWVDCSAYWHTIFVISSSENEIST